MKQMFVAASILLFAPLAWAGNWPGWRGPLGNGHAPDAKPPLTWDAKTNFRWKAPLPDVGNGSPIVWGDRVFITQAMQKTGKRGIICFDRRDGKQLWFTSVLHKEKEPTHGTNPYGSATPVTDGERVITSLGSAGLLCVDFNGKELWRKDLGPQIHIWGNASSPILYGDLCIIWVGPGKNQRLVALNKKTGDDVWEHVEPGGSSGLTDDGKDSKVWIGSWSTPVIAKIGSRDELILSMPNRVAGFNPKSGKELWTCAGLTKLVYTSPTVSPDGVVIAMSGYGGSALAVKAGGAGDVTKNRLWWHKQNQQRIGSGVFVGDRFYMINEPGFGQCFEPTTGIDSWKRERVCSQAWSSISTAEGRLYVTTQGGETVVVKADPKLEVLARNKLPDRVRATPALVDDEVFIRGDKFLWCLGEKK